MRLHPLAILIPLMLCACSAKGGEDEIKPEIVTLHDGALDLGGEVFKPPGKGPFPALLYNHGSAPGMLNSQASHAIGPMFAKMGWVFFMPYRRGQGLSEKAGPYVGDEIAQARRRGGIDQAVTTLVQRMDHEHFGDQAAALAWLRAQPYVVPTQVATAGNSFGGIQALLGAQRLNYCAAVDASGGAESWQEAPALQKLMTEAAAGAKAPVFLFQASNDYSLLPSQVLAQTLKASGHPYELKIYPAFGKTDKDGHSFSYRGASIWFKDVFDFLQLNCQGQTASRNEFGAFHTSPIS